MLPSNVCEARLMVADEEYDERVVLPDSRETFYLFRSDEGGVIYSRGSFGSAAMEAYQQTASLDERWRNLKAQAAAYRQPDPATLPLVKRAYA